MKVRLPYKFSGCRVNVCDEVNYYTFWILGFWAGDIDDGGINKPGYYRFRGLLLFTINFSDRYLQFGKSRYWWSFKIRF